MSRPPRHLQILRRYRRKDGRAMAVVLDKRTRRRWETPDLWSRR